MSYNIDTLLASAPSKDILVGQIAAYWYCGRNSIKLGEKGGIYRNGEDVPCQGFAWTKKKGRYRFEALN
jgi:hypothetical protein